MQTPIFSVWPFEDGNFIIARGVISGCTASIAGSPKTHNPHGTRESRLYKITSNVASYTFVIAVYHIELQQTAERKFSSKRKQFILKKKKKEKEKKNLQEGRPISHP